MQVHKFGGASIATPDRLKSLWQVIRTLDHPAVLVVSAIGKTTNALEAIAERACAGSREEASQMVAALEEEHLQYVDALFDGGSAPVLREALNVLFTELAWAVDDADAGRYDYSYDQIVCMGELIATRILSAYLQLQGYAHRWIDVRDVVRTDDTHRDARVDWSASEKLAGELIAPALKEGNVLTQGFIGATDDNSSVTLGREGSDYTAGMLAAMLGATAVTIWKDVDGLQNADPKRFPNTVHIESISYHEVIEMAYYGAQVIHPKTIKPLQNRHIPLYVRSFLNPSFKGTLIEDEADSLFYPPLIVLKENQILLQVTARDFSFITEDNLSHLYRVFHSLKIKVNLIQNAAISFVACTDHREEQVQALIAALQHDYRVTRNEQVSLLTIRHYTPDVLHDLTRGRFLLLEQKTRHTVQVVMK